MTPWAITSYFNPGRFRRRYANYQAFRRAMPLPLLTVEWSPEARFELADADADRLIQISGGDLMWQKERLLNLAVTELPPDCDHVAWLDCDVLFPDDRWVADMLAALQRAAVIQLFSRVVHLPAVPPESIRAETAHREPALLTRDALAWRLPAAPRPVPVAAPDGDRSGSPDAQREAVERERLAARPSSGHAWAARRDLLSDHGLYDACVCGVGDMATALAALGQPEAFLAEYPLNPAQRAHYRAWAEGFGTAVAGRVDCLSATLFHLFHGRMVDRQYRTRLARMADSGFDPDKQIEPSAQGAWQWAEPDATLARFMADYFRERREDG